MLTYNDSPQLTLAQVQELYDAVGWASYTAKPQNLMPMIENSWLKIAVYDGERLVGLIRVVGDGVTIAYIQDLLIHPDYQKQGIGRELLSRVMKQVDGMRQVFISTDSATWNRHVVDLYRSVGFKPVNELECITLAKFS